MPDPHLPTSASRSPLERIPQSARHPAVHPLPVIRTVGWFLVVANALAEPNLLKNPGFEEPGALPDAVPGWVMRADGPPGARITDREAHGGRECVAIPGRAALEQQVSKLTPGAYLVRGWVKSEATQAVTLLVQDISRPWAAYSCTEVTVPQGQWTQVSAFCPLNQAGSLTVTVGGMSAEFRAYHGAGAEMAAPILADDFELIRYEPPTAPQLALWDAPKGAAGNLDWPARGRWTNVAATAHPFAGTAVFQSRSLVGVVQPRDGSLVLYGLQGSALSPRAVLAPSPVWTGATCELVLVDGRVGLRVVSEGGGRSYTAWLSASGVVRLDAEHVPQFALTDCSLAHVILPSFVGTDLCYDARRLAGAHVSLPSTQWLVGLGAGQDHALVAVWDSDRQAVSLGLTGAGATRRIGTVTVATDQAGFAFALLEHPGLWHQEPLPEDWLEEYTPLAWTPPFPARWMAEFFVTAGGQPSFRAPHQDYAFPIASAKTRMWGVWFEDWNHYPFYFDGARTIAHFEKTFLPNGNALIYFLEPAAADLVSPCEIVEEALGPEKAKALFDWEGNRLRKLPLSTPDEFMYDRPVCATTTRLAHIKQADKATVGMNLATHLYEFIRGIRGRVDQYAAFFAQMKDYLESEQAAHPELAAYVAGLEPLVAEGQAKLAEIYATPLSVARDRVEGIKKRLAAGQGDGFDCGELDVRGIAGAQDDLCRRYNRLVLRLVQTAAFTCGDSAARAALATQIWNQARAVLRRPTRWESRRTLYFFEP